jgi:hypothetical protein
MGRPLEPSHLTYRRALLVDRAGESGEFEHVRVGGVFEEHDRSPLRGGEVGCAVDLESSSRAKDTAAISPSRSPAESGA